jgi:hypothetical protein
VKLFVCGVEEPDIYIESEEMEAHQGVNEAEKEANGE